MTDELPAKFSRVRAWRSPGSWLLLVSILTVGLTLDLSSKALSFARVGPHPVTLTRDNTHIPNHLPRTVIPGVLNLHLVKNEGAVFGIGSNQRVFFIVFTTGALAAACVVFGRWTCRRDRVAHIAIGLILAGGLGNLIDRVRFSVVRDFLHMLPGWKLPFGWRWWGGSHEIFPWVFNLADMMLLLGMGLLMLHINRLERRHHPALDTPPESTSGTASPTASA